MRHPLEPSAKDDPAASAVGWWERGRASQNQGDMGEAGRCFRRSLAIQPALPEASLAEALVEGAAAGPRSILKLRRALALRRDFPEAHTALAHRLMPGEDYYGVLARLHAALTPKLYLEIGVRQGKSLALARPSTQSIGVDPMPCIDQDFVAKTVIYPVTSDDYFSHPDIHRFHRQSPIDMAFIDGLHVFEQALRDFLNVERFASPGALVVIHDCIPLDEPTSAREQTTKFYSGDVWRVIPSLRKARPDLRILLVKAPPTGLALIAGLDPTAGMSDDDFARIVMEGLDLRSSSLFDGQQVVADWSQVSEFLRGSRR